MIEQAGDQGTNPRVQLRQSQAIWETARAADRWDEGVRALIALKEALVHSLANGRLRALGNSEAARFRPLLERCDKLIALPRRYQAGGANPGTMAFWASGDDLFTDLSRALEAIGL